MLDSHELQQHYRTLRTTLRETLSGLTEDQMTERTIDGWSAKDHLTHLAFWDRLRAEEIVRISAGYQSGCGFSEEQVEQLNQIDHALFAACSLEQAWWEVERAHQSVLDAVASASPRGLEPERYSDAALQSDHEAEHIGWLSEWRDRMGY
ncbi:MAG: maleylpyruvate isomerase N-terminal domain-containing protein [Thermomicrobiales bacterium]|nr:maleylpyruvate isomerase N-terminal domain-containing protein [Thermomicrobiales bacterium]